MTTNCKNCRFFFDEFKSIDMGSAGYCLFAPPPGGDFNYERGGVTRGVTRPLTWPQMTCREHQPKQPKEPQE